MYKKLSSVFFREILYLSVRFNLFLQYKPIYMSYTVYIYIYIYKYDFYTVDLCRPFYLDNSYFNCAKLVYPTGF